MYVFLLCCFVINHIVLNRRSKCPILTLTASRSTAFALVPSSVATLVLQQSLTGRTATGCVSITTIYPVTSIPLNFVR